MKINYERNSNLIVAGVAALTITSFLKVTLL